MLPRSAAVDRVLTLREEALADRAAETVDLDALSGRTLADPVEAPGDLPPHDYATMDGYAFDATDEYPLDVVELDVYPEDDPPTIGEGEAVRIATGAPLPERANAVLKREESTVEDGRLRGTDLDPGTYVYSRGSNVAAGDRLFAAGERLSPKDAVLLRDLGIERVDVHRRFSVGVLATGTEIHEGTQSDLDSPMLAGLVEAWGGEATYEGTVPDEYDRVRGRIADLADEYDVVITTGGTSVGKKDYVIRALSDLGEVDFHRVPVRPGKPIAAARLPEGGATAFAIPGKPVGAHTVATLVMRPFFTGEAGDPPSVPATLARDVGLGPAGFEYVIPVTFEDDPGHAAGTTDGHADRDHPTAMPLGHADSSLSVYEETFDPSVLSSSTRATRAEGFVITESPLSAGDVVRVHPYPTVER
ncbi:molybdopterin molybdenumtransferase MoeA [Halobacteriales archaeon QS_8_69_26]|nr:MAG: molybdopterin molybdenumtransferase MoeA [Halobacteriales archaeon QS_8_69_26]